MFEVVKTYFSPSTRIGGPATRRCKDGGVISPPKPYLTWLVGFFVGWKLLLLGVASVSPGAGYDTSTSVLFERYGVRTHSWTNRVVEHITLRLTRWDALYFSTSSERGHLYEQEWAFSWFMARFTAVVSNVLPSFLHTSPIVRHALSGILTSHLAHLGAVVTLYSIVRRMIPSSRDRKPSIAFTAACLHTLSPAGLFLSAPYGESGFALTTFLGILFYILAQEKSHLASQVQPSPLSTAAWTLLSGFSFALSTLFRTNGLLNGTIFLLDALPALSSCLASPSFGNTLHLASTLLAGLLIALAFALPQAIAYSQFCLPPSRPWCSHTIPSIYSYVQKHYWNVGFLSYWTPSNIPLFLLAAPMLAVLFITALVVLLEPGKLLASVNVKGGEESEDGSKLFTHIATQLAIPQIMLAALAITNFHVQIIVRICSGCVVWYVVLAVLVVGGGEGEVGLLGLLGKRRELLVRVMVGYAIVQGGLYASFLPPA